MSLKARLRRGEAAVGGWLTLGSDAIAEIYCDAGFDWIAVDLEHGSSGVSQVERIARLGHAKNVPVLARLSGWDPVEIQHVMDAGVQGVIVPQVTGPDDLASVRSAMFYPPRGHRGVGLARAQGYGARFDEYREWLEQGAVLVAMIENAEAVAQLEGIASFDEVDALFVGPYDLSASLGQPGQLDHPSVVTACEKVLETCAKHERAAGIHVVEPSVDDLQRRLDDGYRFVAYSVDFRMIDAACRTALGGVRR